MCSGVEELDHGAWQKLSRLRLFLASRIRPQNFESYRRHAGITFGIVFLALDYADHFYRDTRQTGLADKFAVKEGSTKLEQHLHDETRKVQGCLRIVG